MPEDFAQQALENLSALVSAPAQNPEMLWIFFPVLGMLLLMQLYFSRHNEELGWNTAFGNGASLIFVFFDLLRTISPEFSISIIIGAANTSRTAAALLVLAYSISILSINFFRLLPAHMSFTLSSYPATICVAYIAIAAVYLNLQFDAPMLLALTVFVSMLAIALIFLKIMGGSIFAIIFPSPGERLEKEMKKSTEHKPKIRW